MKRWWLFVVGLAVAVALVLGRASVIEHARSARDAWWDWQAERLLDEHAHARLERCGPGMARTALAQDLDWPCGETGLVQALADGGPDVEPWVARWCTELWSRPCLRWHALAALERPAQVDASLVALGAPPEDWWALLDALDLTTRAGPDHRDRRTLRDQSPGDPEWRAAVGRLGDLPDRDRATAECRRAVEQATGTGNPVTDHQATLARRARSARDLPPEQCAAALEALEDALADDAPVRRPFDREPWVDAFEQAFGSHRARAAEGRLRVWRAWAAGHPDRLGAAAVALWPDATQAARSALLGRPLDDAGLVELGQWAAREGHPLGGAQVLRATKRPIDLSDAF